MRLLGRLCCCSHGLLPATPKDGFRTFWAFSRTFVDQSDDAVIVMNACRGWQQRTRRLLWNTALRQQHGKDPYQLLEVPKNASYEDVKRAFLTKALKYHPDVLQLSTEEDKQATHGTFIALQQAYDTIIKRFKADCISLDDSEAQFRDPSNIKEFLAFDMDYETRQQVVDLYRSTKELHGEDDGQFFLNDKGGYWEMARQLAEREDNQVDTTTTSLLLEKGSESTIARRRRRRPGST